MKIPLVDLAAQYSTIKTEIDSAIASVVRDCAFIGFAQNPYLLKFEQEFAKWNGTEFAIGCANGTETLELALRAWNIGPGDEVLVPAHTWISTSEAVSWTGAKPVFVDTDEHFLIDLKKVESKINSRTKAIIPVHLYGRAVNMPALLEITKKHRLKVLEDCAQAHGAELQGQKVGTFGDAASYSFFPGKNLGAYGDAGGVVTNDSATAERIRILRNHGRTSKTDHELEGRNSRMDGIQAAVLSVKLKYLDRWTEQRIHNASLYSKKIKKYQTPVTPVGVKHVFHLYVVRIPVVRTPRRDEIEAKLREAGVEVGIHYAKALPELQAYQKLSPNLAEFKNSIKACSEILSLPIFPELKEDQIDRIVRLLEEA